MAAHFATSLRPTLVGGNSNEYRRQLAVPDCNLCRSHARLVASIRLGPEYADPCRGVVGMRPFDALGLYRAVRHVWLGVRSHLDRSRQCDTVPGLWGDLDGRARVRPAGAAAGCSRGWTAVVVLRQPFPGPGQQSGPAHPALLWHHLDLYLAHRL